MKRFGDSRYYVDVEGNVIHAFKLGLRKPRRGSSSNFAKLTEKDVIKIRELSETSDLAQSKIAKMFNISQPIVSEIINRKIWFHI